MMNAYEKIEKLGEGGQGKVYKVRRKHDGEVVVLKMINCTDNAFLKHAETEITVMKGLEHPHIVKMLESFTYKGTRHSYICIIMEYCNGGDLFQKFCKVKKERGRFDEQAIFDWISQISSALQYLHLKDLWHRDVKAANILFTDNGKLKLGDFGLSATYNSKGHNTVVGTPYYFAPEVMLHEKYTNKVDIWNVGVVVLELITLKQQPINVEVLCDQNNVKEKVMKLVTDRGYSRKLGMLVSSMLAKDAQERPSAREVLQQLCGSRRHSGQDDSDTSASNGSNKGAAGQQDDHLLMGENPRDAQTKELRQRLAALPLASGPTNNDRPERPHHHTNHYKDPHAANHNAHAAHPNPKPDATANKDGTGSNTPTNHALRRSPRQAHAAPAEKQEHKADRHSPRQAAPHPQPANKHARQPSPAPKPANPAHAANQAERHPPAAPTAAAATRDAARADSKRTTRAPSPARQAAQPHQNHRTTTSPKQQTIDAAAAAANNNTQAAAGANSPKPRVPPISPRAHVNHEEERRPATRRATTTSRSPPNEAPVPTNSPRQTEGSPTNKFNIQRTVAAQQATAAPITPRDTAQANGTATTGTGSKETTTKEDTSRSSGASSSLDKSPGYRSPKEQARKPAAAPPTTNNSPNNVPQTPQPTQPTFTMVSTLQQQLHKKQQRDREQQLKQEKPRPTGGLRQEDVIQLHNKLAK
eukprot:gene14534-22244_t